jgi:hypothetical protein
MTISEKINGLFLYCISSYESSEYSVRLWYDFPHETILVFSTDLGAMSDFQRPSPSYASFEFRGSDLAPAPYHTAVHPEIVARL